MLLSLGSVVCVTRPYRLSGVSVLNSGDDSNIYFDYAGNHKHDVLIKIKQKKVRKWTAQTVRQPVVGEVTANFSG
jgi:hypothetical protein